MQGEGADDRSSGGRGLWWQEMHRREAVAMFEHRIQR
jgi:hypothetical protein